MIEYTPEDYEFALRILHHREDLTEEEVSRWMDEPEHLELLREMAFVRMSQYEENREEIILGKRRLNRALHGTRRLWVMGSVAASILIILGGLFQIGMIGGRLRGSTEVAAITPGSNKAQLILSDGAIVDLHAAVRQLPLSVIGIIRNDSLEGLKYSGAVGMKEEYNVLQPPVGGFYHLELSDGTRVWLNSESELEYPVLFGKGKRVVKLTGEAFFEVTKDASRPFIVETNDIRTRVLGTSFNIKAYQNEPAIATTLFTGKVEVALLTDTLRRVVLVPGKQADLNLQTNHLSVGEVNLEHVIAWKEGMFMFNKENIEVVTRQIERWYGVKFIYEAGCHKYYTFNGYLSKDESLKTILDALTFTGGPKFKIDENVVYVKD